MIEKILNDVKDVIWSPALVVILVLAGLYFSIRTRFVQVRKIRTMLKLLFAKREKSGKGVSSFQAFCLALSGRVGTGNIVGVATAIALGGPGAIFWMWIIAFLGASTAYVESTLSQLYKFKHKSGYRGGPFCYIEQGLKCKWLAIIFALVTILGLGIFSPPVQSNGVAMAANNVFNIPLWVTGLITASVLAFVIIGGVKRIASFAEVITPIMAIIYILLSLVIVAINWRQVPYIFLMIIKGAFGFSQFGGGLLGSTISMGVKRGLYSNEAGEGTGAIVSASADVKNPEHQGLVQAFSVYIDTLLVCSATAFMILSTGMYNVFDPNTSEALLDNEFGHNYVEYTQMAVDTLIPNFGSCFVCIALFFFAFTTIIAYYFYAETSIIYLTQNNKRMEKAMIWVYRFVILAMVILGSVQTADAAWALGDIGIGLTTWINIIVILILAPQAIKLIRK